MSVEDLTTHELFISLKGGVDMDEALDMVAQWVGSRLAIAESEAEDGWPMKTAIRKDWDRKEKEAEEWLLERGFLKTSTTPTSTFSNITPDTGPNRSSASTISRTTGSGTTPS